MGAERSDHHIHQGQGMTKLANGLALPPPPPPPPFRMISKSFTQREIEKFWRKKRWVEEDHFLAAIKAAARLRATHLSKEDYMVFMESLEEESDTNIKDFSTINIINNQDIRVGIKDWWTKSKYAYLNQPAVGSTASRRSRRSNYIPNKMVLYNYNYHCDYKRLSTTATPVTAPVQPAYLGVF